MPSSRTYSSQLSLDSAASVPDLTDRVVRVSFAREGGKASAAASRGNPVRQGRNPVTSEETGEGNPVSATHQVPEDCPSETAELGSISNISVGKRNTIKVGGGKEKKTIVQIWFNLPAFEVSSTSIS